MNEAEVEAIVVRLTGNSSGYVKALQEAGNQSKETEEAILSVKNHVDGFGKSLTRFGEIAVSAIWLKKLKDFFSESMNAWADQENAILKMGAVLESNGRNVEELQDHYDKFSSSMQEMTTQADEVTLGMLAQAESFGITGAAAEQATRDAMGFAAMNDGNANSFLRLTVAMARGDSEMVKRMARMVPQLRGIKDETELMAKATKLAATGFDLAQKQAGTFKGMMTQLNNAWGDIMEDVGKTIAEIGKPFVELTKQGVDFLKSFSFEVKAAVTTVLGLVAVLASIGPAVSVWKGTVSPLLTMMDDGFRLAKLSLLAMLNPINWVKWAFVGLQAIIRGVGIAIKALLSWPALLLMAFIAVIAMIVEHFGGLQATWEIIKATGMALWDSIKQAASDFMEWFRPIGEAIAGVASAAWELIKEGAMMVWEVVSTVFTYIWNYIKEVWSSVTGDTELNWTAIKDWIVDALIVVEFAIRNFKMTWELAVSWAILKAVEFYENLKHFFGTTIPTFLSWFGRNWRTIWKDAASFVETVVVNIGSNLHTFFRNIPGMIRGSISLSEVRAMMRPITEGFRAETERLVIPERLRSALETQLAVEFDVLNNAYGESLETFRERRLREIAEVRRDPTTGPVTEMVEKDRKGAEKELKKLESALLGSADSLSKILAHQDMVRGIPKSDATRSASSGASEARSANSIARQLSLTERIEEHLRVMRERPVVPVAPAGLR